MSRIADWTTRWFGSWTSVLLHTVWFVAWLVIGLDVNSLTLAVSLEAIYLGILILMSTNRQAARDRERDDRDDVEVTETLRLVRWLAAREHKRMKGKDA